MGSESLLVRLEFAPGQRPVRGCLSSPGRPDRGFTGWTELFAALEAVLDDRRSAPDSKGEPPDAQAR